MSSMPLANQLSKLHYLVTIANYLKVDVKAIQTQLGHTESNMIMIECAQGVDAARVEGFGHMEGVLLGRVQLDADTSNRLGTGVMQ